jgi:hypothetical protein
MRPQEGSYPAYYKNYLSLVPENDILAALQSSTAYMNTFVAGLPAGKENHAYKPGKWTVKEVLMHISDTERILAYRALRFARKDPQMPLSFDENSYAAASGASSRTITDILAEMNDVRRATVALYAHLNGDTLLQTGMTGAGQTTVLALGFMICGHCRHHLNVIGERYL